MTGDEPKPTAVVPYAVGYSRPPVEQRFKKGQSGNPRGRPAGSKAAGSSSLDADRAKALLLEEAYRPVRVREGESVIELPAIQAVFRAIGVSAMQGNRFAQRTLAEMVAKTEGEQTAILTTHYASSVEYKVSWEREIDRCRRLGLPEPEPLPHPADILIDPRKGIVRIVGPRTSEEKAYFESIVVLLKVLQSQVTRYALLAKRARSPGRRDSLLVELHDFQLQFDQLNDVIFPRYRTELRDRSTHPSASKSGEFARKMGIKLPGPPPRLKLPDVLLQLLEELR